MQRLARVLVWLTAAFWLPATLHCAIDQAGLFEASPTCCDHDSDRMPEDRACGERCVVLEGGVKVSTDHASVPAPNLLAVVDWLAASELQAREAPAQPAGTPESPPELARTWQFVARAALPPRAPSRVS